MKRTRIAVMGTAVVVLPVVVGGFVLQRREATDAARLFAQVFARGKPRQQLEIRRSRTFVCAGAAIQLRKAIHRIHPYPVRAILS